MLLQSLLRAMLLVAVPALLSAQDSSEPSRILWFIYGGDHRLTGRTSLLLDFHGRAEAVESGWRQYLVRPGLSVRVAGTERVLRVAAGYASLRTTELIGDPASPRSAEHRAWEMLQLNHARGPLSLVHRLRLEQRWTTLASGVPGAAAHRDYANRARYALRAAAPLGRLAPLQASVSEELFAGFGGSAGTLEFDQNRLTLALGAHLRPTLRAEVGYLNQATREGGALAVRRHALYVGMSSTEPFGR